MSDSTRVKYPTQILTWTSDLTLHVYSSNNLKNLNIKNNYMYKCLVLVTNIKTCLVWHVGASSTYMSMSRHKRHGKEWIWREYIPEQNSHESEVWRD